MRLALVFAAFAVTGCMSLDTSRPPIADAGATTTPTPTTDSGSTVVADGGSSADAGAAADTGVTCNVDPTPYSGYSTNCTVTENGCPSGCYAHEYKCTTTSPPIYPKTGCVPVDGVWCCVELRCARRSLKDEECVYKLGTGKPYAWTCPVADGGVQPPQSDQCAHGGNGEWCCSSS